MVLIFGGNSEIGVQCARVLGYLISLTFCQIDSSDKKNKTEKDYISTLTIVTNVEIEHVLAHLQLFTLNLHPSRWRENLASVLKKIRVGIEFTIYYLFAGIYIVHSDYFPPPPSFSIFSPDK